MLFFSNQPEENVLISHLDSFLSVFFLFNFSVLHLRNQNCTPCSRYPCLLLPGTIACYEILLQASNSIGIFLFWKGIPVTWTTQLTTLNFGLPFIMSVFIPRHLLPFPSPLFWLHNEHYSQRWRIYLILRQMEFFYYLLHSSKLSF